MTQKGYHRLDCSPRYYLVHITLCKEHADSLIAYTYDQHQLIDAHEVNATARRPPREIGSAQSGKEIFGLQTRGYHTTVAVSALKLPEKICCNSKFQLLA